jgi:hypothetical protein
MFNEKCGDMFWRALALNWYVKKRNLLKSNRWHVKLFATLVILELIVYAAFSQSQASGGIGELKTAGIVAKPLGNKIGWEILCTSN